MFAYLSKKIGIPNGLGIRTLAWNKSQGYLATGGAEGLAKVLKLESMGGGKLQGLAAPSNLTMNQSLDGHSGAVVRSAWNEPHRKLATSDEHGLITVWLLYRGRWYEEMINNRNKSVVTDMRWTADGQKIAIVYKDGAVIVGSVEGTRLWGRDYDLVLMHVEWSPDGRLLLFGTEQGEIHVHDSAGNFISKLALYALMDTGGSSPLVGIEWYNGLGGYIDANPPTLALGFENGRVQITTSEMDDQNQAIIIDTGKTATRLKWNPSGSVLAVACVEKNDKGGNTASVQFYNPFGQHLRSLKVSDVGSIADLTWEGTGLRLALGVGPNIIFANIRPDYRWVSFGTTVAYAFAKPDRVDLCVIFWDTATDEKYVKYVKRLHTIAGAGDYACLITRSEETDAAPQWIVILCNAIGNPLDSRYITVEPKYVTMTPNHIIVASDTLIWVWRFDSPATQEEDSNGVSTSTVTSKLRTDMRLARGPAGGADTAAGAEWMFHVDDKAVKPPVSETPDASAFEHPTEDIIASIAASDKYLLVTRISGICQRYTLPNFTPDCRFKLNCRPSSLYINCDSSRLAVVDLVGVLRLFDLNDNPGAVSDSNSGAGKRGVGKQFNIQRKDAWCVRWADDNPELFAVMEKTRMYIFRGTDPEEPVSSSGYPCSFSDLVIRCVFLDELMADASNPSKEYVINFETKSLRDTREILSNVGINEAFQFVQENPHPRLWRSIAEYALDNGNLDLAESAFVKRSDYPGIQLVKRLRVTHDPKLRSAEVASYFGRFEEAEKLYEDVDRPDMAIALRRKLGDWFRVESLLQSGASGDDVSLRDTWDAIGEYYMDRLKWGRAVSYFQRSNNMPRLIEALFMLEDYEALQNLIGRIPERDMLLSTLGGHFRGAGLHEASVNAYLRGDNVRAAIDACVELNQWNTAVELAEEHNLPEIELLLSKYATHLKSKGETLPAVELYRKAARNGESAGLLADLAKTASTSGLLVRAKKLYILGAMELDEAYEVVNKLQKAVAASGGPNTAPAGGAASMIDGLLAGATDSAPDSGSSKTGPRPVLDKRDKLKVLNKSVAVASTKLGGSSWRGAEAMHYMILAETNLYRKNFDDALRAALRARDYEDLLDEREVHSVVALAAFYAGWYRQASRAFIRLESMASLTEEQRTAYADLAMNIFIKHPPNDPVQGARQYKCPSLTCSERLSEYDTSCDKCGVPVPACVLTGRSMFDLTEAYRCPTCKRNSSASLLNSNSVCALCHTPVQ